MYGIVGELSAQVVRVEPTRHIMAHLVNEITALRDVPFLAGPD